MEAICTDISKTSYTLTQVQHQVEVWRSVVETALFHETDETAQERYDAAVANLAKDEQEVAAQWDSTQWLPRITTETFSNYLEQLRAWAASVKTLVVYVPVELPGAEVSMLAQAVRSTYAEDSFIDVRIDPNVTGGCSFIVGEQYYDYSLHGQLKRYPEIMSEIFNAYVE